MPESLIVNCSLDKDGRIDELVCALTRFSECAVVHFSDIGADYEVEEDVGAIVLGGSKARIVDPSDRALFKNIVDLIKRVSLPVFGICYGHQLLCWTFGCEVGSLTKPMIDTQEQVHIIEADGIFAGFQSQRTVPLAESHYDYVLKCSLDRAGFTLLADSPSCEVEAVKRKQNPFYGVQFHPERAALKSQKAFEGYKIIENFYQNVVGQGRKCYR